MRLNGEHAFCREELPGTTGELLHVIFAGAALSARPKEGYHIAKEPDDRKLDRPRR